MNLKDVGSITCKSDGYVNLGATPPYQFKFEVSKCNRKSEWLYVREDHDFVNVVQAAVADKPGAVVTDDVVDDSIAKQGSDKETTNVPLHHWVILENREGKYAAVCLADIFGEGRFGSHIHLVYGFIEIHRPAKEAQDDDVYSRLSDLEEMVAQMYMYNSLDSK